MAQDLYHPPGMWVWDIWMAEHEGVYHAYYLQAARALPDPALKHGHQHVGHSVSTDLINWENRGPALVPVHGSWNDLSIATGSIAKHDGKWWMLFTGRGSRQSGIGLAVSDDLEHWAKVGEEPVIDLGREFAGTWRGEELKWRGLADPYVLPEAVDGWFTLVINAHVIGAPEGTRGCLAAMRSRDMRTWEPAGILAYPTWFERMETPQLWQRGGRWTLYFGAHGQLQSEALHQAVPESAQAANFALTADDLLGPYEGASLQCLKLPDGKWCYICKVFRGPDGRDVLLTTVDYSLSRPYRVAYGEDGAVDVRHPLPTTGEVLVPRGDETVPVWLILPDGYTGREAHPLVLFHHGRGYGSNAQDTNMLKGEFADFRRFAGERGYVLAAVAVGPDTWMNETARARTDAALAYLTETLNIDPGAVFTMGVSMGGGAALTYVKHRPGQVGAAVDFMGVSDFARFYREGFYNESLQGALGGTPGDVPEVYAAQSACEGVQGLRGTPVMLIHGDKDTVIPPWNATELWPKVEALDNGSELVLRKGMGHTNEIVQGLEERILNFLDKAARE